MNLDKDGRIERRTTIKLDQCSICSRGRKITVTGGTVTVFNAEIRPQQQDCQSGSARH